MLCKGNIDFLSGIYYNGIVFFRPLRGGKM